MRWRDLRRSSNVRDLRGQRPRMGIPLRIGRRGGGIGMILVLIAIGLIGGPELLQQIVGGGIEPSSNAPATPDRIDDQAEDFTAAILGSTEDVWGGLFAEAGARYRPPELTLFAGAVSSACGFATSAVGPFYCPADGRVYLDTDFFDELARMGGPGDFAQAYVIGHEIGHHVQNLTGTAAQVREARAGGGASANPLQVAMELQADCYAGVWAWHANREHRVLEPGDVEEGLAAAAAIGDDRLQRSAGREVTPDSFTHGSSAERQRWLERGLATGDPAECDTFGETS